MRIFFEDQIPPIGNELPADKIIQFSVKVKNDWSIMSDPGNDL